MKKNDPPHIIGVCLSKLQEEYRLHCIDAINRYAVAKGYRLFIFHSKIDFYLPLTPTDTGEMFIFQLINHDMLDAMIIFSGTILRESLLQNIEASCRAHGVPVLSMDKNREGCINFRFDYSNTFEKLCRHVVEEHGKKRVFLMAGMKDNDFSEERVDAFRKVISENGLSPEECRIGYGDFWEKPTLETMEQWFLEEKLPFPEAIICANDSMALTVSLFLQNHGCRVPEDCIITGFDGIMQANYHVPHLTTCTQDYDTMGRLLVDTVERLRRGESVESSYTVDFHILYSQSCGCHRTAAINVNTALQDIMDQLKLANERQELTCQVQSAVTSMASLSELPEVILNKFIFHTIVFALNDDLFRAPEFGENHREKMPFSDSVNVLCQRYFWNPEEPCIIARDKMVPNLPKLLEKENPIVFCPLHFADLSMGYCVFQTDITNEAYEKMNSFMNAMDSALGIFHTQLHTKSINMQLKSANSELEKLYVHDHMTGLLNRRGFYRQFWQQIEESRGKDLSVVIISADLDGLKRINDTYGHTEGDNTISTVGRALMTSAIQGEVCSRFGGDEFTVAGVISGVSDSYFDSFRDRFRNYLQQYNRISQKPYLVESSIGFCIQPLKDDNHIDLDQMIKIADDHMYEDKVRRRKARQ